MTITKEIARGERYREAIRVIEEKARKMGYKEIAEFSTTHRGNIGYIFHNEITTEYDYYEDGGIHNYYAYADGIAYNPKTDNTIPMKWWVSESFNGSFGFEKKLDEFVAKDNFICEMGVKEKGNPYPNDKALEEAYEMAKGRGYESYKSSLTPHELLEVNVSMKKYKEMLEENNPERFDHLRKALELGVNLDYDYEKYHIIDDLEKNNKFKEIYYMNKYDSEYIDDIKESLEKSITAGQWTERELFEEAKSYIKEAEEGHSRYWLEKLLALEEDFGQLGMAKRALYKMNIKEYGDKEMWVVNRDESGMGFLYKEYDPYTTTEAQFLITKDELLVIKNDCCFDVWTVRDDKRDINGLFIGEEGRDCPWNGIFIDKVSDIGYEINYEDKIFSPDDLFSVAKNLTSECREINECYTKMVPTSLMEEDEVEQEL